MGTKLTLTGLTIAIGGQVFGNQIAAIVGVVIAAFGCILLWLDK